MTLKSWEKALHLKEVLAQCMAVLNGVVTYSGVVLGSVATLTCDTEYSITNEYNRTCMSDGHWSKGTLRCEQETTAGECYTAIQTVTC